MNESRSRMKFSMFSIALCFIVFTAWNPLFADGDPDLEETRPRRISKARKKEPVLAPSFTRNPVSPDSQTGLMNASSKIGSTSTSYLPHKRKPFVGWSSLSPKTSQLLRNYEGRNSEQLKLARKMGISLPSENVREIRARGEWKNISAETLRAALFPKYPARISPHRTRDPETVRQIRPEVFGEGPAVRPPETGERHVARHPRRPSFAGKFANMRGGLGNFNTATAFTQPKSFWSAGIHARYDKYKYLNDRSGVVKGHQWFYPLNIVYSKNKLTAGLTVPRQSWEVGPAGTGRLGQVSMNYYHDSRIRVAYQAWKDAKNEKAFAFHLARTFPSDAYHQPLKFFEGKSRVGATRVGPFNVGPAGATRGAWTEVGTAYSVRSEKSRWSYDLNLAHAENAKDDYSKGIYGVAVKYKKDDRWSWVGEISGETWGKTGFGKWSNADFTPGVVYQSGQWQATLGVPLAIARQFGYGHDYGVIFGVATTWN